MLHQVLGIGVTIGNSVFGLFQEKVCPSPRMKRFIYTLFILKLASFMISRLMSREKVALTLGIHSSYYHQKE